MYFSTFYNEHNPDNCYYFNPYPEALLKTHFKSCGVQSSSIAFVLLGLNVFFIKHCPSRKTKTSDYFFFQLLFSFYLQQYYSYLISIAKIHTLSYIMD